MIRHFIGLCVLLALIGGSIAAQERSNAVPTASVNPKAGAISAKNKTASTTEAEEEARDLRRQQLRSLKEFTMTRVVSSISDMDEAGLRMSARNQLLAYLSRNRVRSEEDKTLAAKIASEALADFDAHSEEIQPFMATYLLGDLGAWIQKYQPDLTGKFQAVTKDKGIDKESDRIHALLALRGGDALAAQLIRQRLTSGQAIDGLNFYLDDLRQHNSKEFEPLMSEIVDIAAQGPQISFETLFWISDSYLRPEIPAALKRHFLAMVVTRTQPANLVGEQALQTAYDLLNKVLPFIQALSPELYDQAAAQSFSMRASFTERQIATEERNKRLKESLDPVEELIAEAKKAKSKAEGNESLAEAARLACEKKSFARCLDIVARLDLDAGAIPPDFWRKWADQFLKDFIKTTLADKDITLAENGAEHISSSLAKVEGLNLIMQYQVKIGDRSSALQLLAEARKVADGAPDYIEKAKAFFLLSTICDQIDETLKAELLEAAIKATNNVSKPEKDVNNRQPVQQYVRNLDITGYRLIKGFKGLAEKDEIAALGLIDKFQKPDLKTLAMIGILQGVDEALAK